MNLLFHHRLAWRDLGDVAAGGAMLPDLWRMSDRTARARSAVAVEGPAACRQLLLGIEHHLAIDRVFHRSGVFETGLEPTRALLERGGWPRPGLLAHPAFELALDGALLRREGVETTLERLRTSLAHLDAERLQALGRAHQLSPLRESSRAEAFRARLSQLLGELKVGDWPRGYADPLGLAHRLAGLVRRLGLSPPARIEPLAEVLDIAQARLDEALMLHPSNRETD